MRHPDDPRRYRASTLWALAIGLVLVDAAVLWVGFGYGIIGIAIAFCIILWTQRRADAYWRAHNAATRESVV